MFCNGTVIGQDVNSSTCKDAPLQPSYIEKMKQMIIVYPYTFNYFLYMPMSSKQNPVILSFDTVSFAYNDGKKPILVEADFTLREDTKITIMGQNGAGKSTIFKLITGELKPQIGKINIGQGKTIAISKQVIPRDMMHMTIREYFETAFAEKDYQLDKKIAEAFEAVNFTMPLDKYLKDMSGGQQARILLAYALIQKPDILLLDEPTNNLDTDGINHLIGFLL